jgi:hypothetical protein
MRDGETTSSSLEYLWNEAHRSMTIVSDAGVEDARGVKPQEISVLREDDSPKRQRKRNLLLVTRLQEASFGRGGDVDASASQPQRDRPAAILIEVEAYRPSHGPS